jgi:hypothetical protein
MVGACEADTGARHRQAQWGATLIGVRSRHSQRVARNSRAQAVWPRIRRARQRGACLTRVSIARRVLAAPIGQREE